MKNTLNTIHPNDVKRLSGKLTKQQKAKLPANIDRIQGALQLSRTQVLEREGLINPQVENETRSKIHRFEKLELKRMKAEAKPLKGEIIRPHN